MNCKKNIRFYLTKIELNTKDENIIKKPEGIIITSKEFNKKLKDIKLIRN